MFATTILSNLFGYAGILSCGEERFYDESVNGWPTLAGWVRAWGVVAQKKMEGSRLQTMVPCLHRLTYFHLRRRKVARG